MLKLALVQAAVPVQVAVLARVLVAVLAQVQVAAQELAPVQVAEA